MFSAQLTRQLARFAIHPGAQRRNVNVRALGWGWSGLGQRHDQAVFADGEADAGCGRSTEGFGESVVAATAEDRVLGSEGAVGELEGGARVVVEAPYQLVVPREGHADSLENRLDLVEVRAAALVEELADAGQFLDDGLILGNLAVKHAQGIGHGAALTVGAHLRSDRFESSSQGFVEARAIRRTAHGIQFEGPSLNAQTVEQGGQHFKNFRVARGRLAACRRWADHLGADLVELAVAALLRTLAAELRTDVVELVQTAFPEFVFDVGPDNAGGVFGTQSERLALVGLSAAAVLPGVHFL